MGGQSIQVQVEGFSLPELQECSVFCRRCSVRLSVLQLVVKGSSLWKLFCWGVSLTVLAIIDVQWYETPF